MRLDKPTFNEPTRHVGLQLERSLYEAVKRLAQDTGVSMNYAIRRSLMDMVSTGVVPMEGVMRDEEVAESTEPPVPAPISSQRLQELERDFQRVQEELASIKAATGNRRTATYDGRRPVGRPRIVRTTPVGRAQ